MNLCVSDSDICKEILKELNSLISQYRKITKTKDSFNKIIVHSGSAPIYGWIDNKLGNYLELGEAIHETPLDNHEKSQYHFRDVYVWHAWLKNNTFGLFQYTSEAVHIIGEEKETRNLRRIDYLMSGEFKPDEPNSYFFVNDLRNEQINEEFKIDYDSLETYQERFISDFDKLNKQYPFIGLFHRCLIVIRNFNEKFAIQFIDEGILLQKIYYPLFYYINLFIHIATIYYALGNVDYYVLFSSKSPFNENAVIRENALKNEHYIKSHPKFKTFKKKIKNILDTSYTNIVKIYGVIKNYIEEQITNRGPRKSIIEFDVPYFDVSLESVVESNSNNTSSIIETAGYKTNSRRNNRVNTRKNKTNPQSKKTRTKSRTRQNNLSNNQLRRWVHSDYLNNVQRNYSVDRETAYRQLKLNNFDEDLSRKRYNISKITNDDIYKFIHGDFIAYIVKTFQVDEEDVYQQLKSDNFDEYKSLEFWNSYWS